MIPQHKQDAVKKALQTAFGVNEYDSIEPLLKGLSSALVFKIRIGGSSYLLRVITRTDPMADPSYYHGCMEMAANAGIAPHVYYQDSKDRVSITGFIEEQPFPMDVAKKTMPVLIRELHSLPKFPFRINYFHAMEGFMEKFRASGVIREDVTEEVFKAYHTLAAIYPRNNQDDWVSCHNDLKPENIIYDGTRPWMVDWEGAFLNDRYHDLAVFGNFVLRTEADEAAYLKAYFGTDPDEYQRARFFIMGQMLHVYYFTFLTLTACGGKPVTGGDGEAEDFRKFQDAIWEGKVDLSDNDSKLRYGWLHKEAFQRNIDTSRWREAKRVMTLENRAAEKAC